MRLIAIEIFATDVLRRSDRCDRPYYDKTEPKKSGGDRLRRERLTCPSADECVSISDKVDLRPRTHGPLAKCTYICDEFGRLRLSHAAFASQMTDDGWPLDKAARGRLLAGSEVVDQGAGCASRKLFLDKAAYATCSAGDSPVCSVCSAKHRNSDSTSSDSFFVTGGKYHLVYSSEHQSATDISLEPWLRSNESVSSKRLFVRLPA